MPISDRMAEALKESYQGLEKKITERTRDLSALYAALAPLASVDSTQLLQQIVERLKEATGADAALIRILDKETKSFHSPAHVGFSSSYLQASQDLDERSVVRSACMSGAPVIAANIAQDTRFKGKRQMEAGFRSCAFLPLKVSGELRGIVHLASREVGHFSVDKTDHLMAIARQMGVAMENRELLEAAKRRAREQEALNVIARATSQSLRRDELLQIALDKVLEVTGRERGSVRLKNPETDEITLAVHRGLSQEEIEGLSRTVSRQATEQVFASGQPRIVNARPEAADAGSLLPRSHSVAWIPMKTGAKVTGVLCVSTTRPVPFLQHEVDLLQAIASVINVSLENVQLYENERRQVSSLRLLVEASRKLIDRVDINTLAQDILQTVVTSFGIRLAWIGSAEADGRVRPLYWAGDVAEYLRHVEIRWDDSPLGHGPAGRAIRTGQPVVMDVATDPGFAPWREPALAHGYREVAAFPLMRGAKPFGHLILYSDKTGFFNPERVELLQSYTNIATATLEGARLLDETKRQALEKSALNTIATAVSQTLEVQEILNIALDKVLEVTGREKGYIRLKDPLTDELKLAAHRGISEKYVALVHRRTPGGKSDQVLKTGEPIIINASERALLREETRQEENSSIAWIPLKAQGKVVGILNVSTAGAASFTSREVDLLQAIGNVIGIAVENAQLFEETARRAREQAAVNAIAMAVSKSLKIEEILTIALDKVIEVTKRERGYIRLRDPVSGEFSLGAHRGMSEVHIENLKRGTRAGGRSDQVFTSGEPVVINNLDKTSVWAETRREGFQSMAWIPLTTRGKVVGILNLGTGQPIPFTPQDVELLRAIGNVIGIAVENARLFEETEQRAQEQAVLNDIAVATSQSLHLDELLQKSLDSVLYVMGRDRGYIRLQDPVTGKLRLAAHRGISKEYIEALLHQRTPGGKGDQVFESGEVLVINNVEAVTLKEETRREGSHALIWVPLKARGKVVGLLNIATSQMIPFAPREVELLQAIGNVIGVALENARLFEETEQKARHLSTLHTVASTVSASLNLDQLVAKALDIILEVTGMDAGHIRLLEGDPPRLHLKVHKGVPSELVEKLRCQTRDGGKAEQVLTGRRPLVFESTQTSGPERPPQLLSHGFTTAVWIPITLRDKALGIINVATSGNRAFDRNQLLLLEAIGASLGVALDNARLFEETERRASELAALYAVTAAVSGSFDIEDILLKGLDAVLEVAGMDGGYIQFLDGTPPKLVLKVHRGMSESFIAKTHTEIRPGGKMQQIIETKQPLVLEDIPPEHTGKFSGEKITAAAWVPITSKDKVIAILVVSTKIKRKFPQARLPLLVSIANALGVALENVRLFQETGRNLERIRALREIDQAISSTLDLRNVLDILLEKIDLSLPYASATIRLLNKDTGLLDPIACRNLDEQEWKASQWRGGRGIANVVFTTKAPLIIRNVQADARVLDREFYLKNKLISYVGVPLIVKDEILGVLGFYTKETHEFTDEEVEFLSTLAGQAAIAIHNSQLYEETEHRRREAEELARVAQSLTETLDMTAVGERIVTSVRELFGAKTAILRLLQPDGSLRALASSGETFLQDSRVGVISDGMGIVGQAVAEGRSIWSRDVLNDPKIRLSDEMREYHLQSGNRSMMAVPLHAHERVIGSLGLSDLTGRVYSEREIALLQTFADQAALALENARLYNEARARETQLQETNRMLSGLHAVAAAVSQSLDLDRVLHAAIEKITDIFAFDATQIHISNERTDELFLRAAFERDPSRFATAKSFRRGQGIVGKVAESGNSLIFEDVQNDPLYRQFSRSKISSQSGYRFFAVFPIRGKLRNLGTLACTGVEPRKLSSGEIQLLEAMADQIAVAIENGELYEQLRQKVEELQQANKVKDEFLSVMSHELRTPLNIVMGYTAMIKDEMLGSVNTEQRKALEKVVTRSNDLLNMITSILHATSIEAKEVRVQNTRFSLPDLLDELKKVYDTSLSNSITLNWDYPSDMPLLTLDRDKVRVVLQKLIDNATKFTERGRIAISARVKESGGQTPPKELADQPPPQRMAGPPQEDRAETGKRQDGEESLSPHAFLEVKVDDTGVGITKEKLPIIFEKFRQADSSETRRFGGVGLGLFIAKHFIELMGGNIKVDTEEGKGSIFTVVVPCLVSYPEAANQSSETQEAPAHIEQAH